MTEELRKDKRKENRSHAHSTRTRRFLRSETTHYRLAFLSFVVLVLHGTRAREGPRKSWTLDLQSQDFNSVLL